MSTSSEASTTSICSSSDEQCMYFEDFYDLSIFLYRGQFGDYYRCIDKETNGKCMVKIIKPFKSWNTGGITTTPTTPEERFSREGVIWRRMKHKNIVEFIRMFKSSKEQFLVTEYVKDGNLFDQIGQYTTYSERDACHFARQLLDALVYLRNKRVIHRNINTENILVKHNAGGDILKLCGFSLCVRLDKHQKYINTEPYGVPLHLPPEVLREKPISYSVDSWSVGTIIFVLLSGQPPFWRETLPELYSTILTQDFLAESFYWNNVVSTEAEDLLSRLLEKNPAMRLTPEQALRHDWFKENLPKFHRQDVVEKICELNTHRKSCGTLFTVQRVQNNNSRREQPRNSNLISSSFGEKRRAKLYEQQKQNHRHHHYHHHQVSPSKMTVVSKTKVDLNNNRTQAKVCLHLAPPKVFIDLLAASADEGVDL